MSRSILKLKMKKDQGKKRGPVKTGSWPKVPCLLGNGI